MHFAPNQTIRGQYKIVEMIGKGGQGNVYAGTDRNLNTTVAVKQMTLTGSEMLRAFEREAKLLSRLRHPSLPVVIDYF